MFKFILEEHLMFELARFPSLPASPGCSRGSRCVTWMFVPPWILAALPDRRRQRRKEPEARALTRELSHPLPRTPHEDLRRSSFRIDGDEEVVRIGITPVHHAHVSLLLPRIGINLNIHPAQFAVDHCHVRSVGQIPLPANWLNAVAMRIRLMRIFEDESL